MAGSVTGTDAARTARTMPPSPHGLLAEDLDRLRETPRRERPAPPTTPPGPTLEQFERLLWILRLTDEERGFVLVALTTPQGDDFWGVLADYLEERNVASAGRFRGMARAEPCLVPVPPEILDDHQSGV